VAAQAQLPNKTYGWNLGNTMEPPSGVGTWSAPAPTQALIEAVAKAGFNVIRIPCAWNSHADKTNYQIDPVYMAQVKQVIDWCYAKHLYVIINEHWDGGWLENHITDTVNPEIDAKMKSYWTQIATSFAQYDDHLLFAGANEPNVKNALQMATLTAYYNTFIAAVRSCGGNNTHRWLVVQGPSTDIDKTDQLMKDLPKDPTKSRLMVEIHYYSPYNYCGLEADQSWGKMFYYWGKGYHSSTDPTRNSTWGEEDFMDAQFQKMTAKFVDLGIPVLLGEFGAMKRSALTGADLALHLAGRIHFHKCVVDSAQKHGLYPFFWDVPGSGQAFDRNTGAVSDPDIVRVLTGGVARE
jgi:aryl-phospho-beta-D-glucosidase BglC (GH1 family)